MARFLVVARELVLVGLGVSATLLMAKVVGLPRWTSIAMREWPDFHQRHDAVFPWVLLVFLLMIRLWSPIKENFAYAGGAGGVIGYIAGFVALILAQSWPEEARERLINGVNLDLFAFIVILGMFTTLATLAWLQGCVASVMTFLADRLLSTYGPSR